MDGNNTTTLRGISEVQSRLEVRQKKAQGGSEETEKILKTKT